MIDLETIKGRLPEELWPWADEYGPSLLAMGAEGIKAWIEKLLRGDVYGAYADVLANMEGPGERLSEWRSLEGQWGEAVKKNAERIALQKAAATGLLRILLAIALAMVGL